MHLTKKAKNVPTEKKSTFKNSLSMKSNFERCN